MNIPLKNPLLGRPLRALGKSPILRFAALLTATAFAPLSAHAFDYIVTSTADSGVGTLRQALTDANASAANDTITFDETSTFVSKQTITLGGSQLPVGKAQATSATNNGGTISITGPTAGVVIAGNNASRIFSVNAHARATLNGLTISGGRAPNTNTKGGSIFVNPNATLAVNTCTISGNSAAQTGGGIHNAGTVTVSNSTISGNTATGNGGGIYNESTGNTTLRNSTITGNTANSGGGIFNVGGSTLTTINATISGNTATAGGGGGVFNNGGTFSSSNSIIAVNTPGNISGNQPSGSNNIVSDSATAAQIGLDSGLKNNGGPTETIALLSNGTAVNTGSNAAANLNNLNNDQRGTGFDRIIGGTVDIGAFENETPNTAPTVAPTITPTSPTTNQTITVNPNGNDADGDMLTYVYTFSVNDTQKQSGSSETFDLGVAGNGDKGQTVSVSVVVTDANASSATGTAQVTVANSAPTLANASFNGTTGTAFSQQLIGSDADGDSLTYSTTDALPNGLALSSDGAITGTPTTSGNFTVTVAVSDSTSSGSAQISFVIAQGNVNTPPTLNNKTFTAGLGVPFSTQLLGSDPDMGDTLAYVATDALPSGLMLSQEGVLSGTPNVAGTFRFGVTVSDGRGGSATARFAFVVRNVPAGTDSVAPVITRNALPASGTRDDFAARTLGGKVRDMVQSGVLASGVKRVLIQLRSGDNKQAYNGSTFTSDLTKNYYIASLTAGGVDDERDYSRPLSFLPADLAPNDYILLLYPQDKAGNYSAEYIAFTVTAPATSMSAPAKVAPGRSAPAVSSKGSGGES